MPYFHQLVMGNRILVFLLAYVMIPLVGLSQTPSIEWERSYGGANYDRGYCIEQTSDGGYIIAGSTQIDGGTLSYIVGNTDVWVGKINSLGDIEWVKTFDNSGREEALAVKQTSDGGFILVGYYSSATNSNYNHPFHEEDVLVIKIDANGNLEWQNTYGGNLKDRANAVEIGPDGTYMVLGYTYSNDGDVKGLKGQNDVWLVNLDLNGNIIRERCFGGSMSDLGSDIKRTADGFVIGGVSGSNDGDVNNSSNSSGNGWVLKINNKWEVLWEKRVNNHSFDKIESVSSTSDGGVIAGGYSYSSDVENQNRYRFYFVKFNDLGEVIWERTINTMNTGILKSISESEYGEIISVGYGTLDNNNNGFDYLLFVLSSEGDILWEMKFGGSKHDFANHILQTIDGGYIIAGMTESSDFHVSENNGVSDIWIVKLNSGPIRIRGKNKICLEETVSYRTNTSLQSNWYIDGQFQGYSDTLNLIFDTEGNHILRACYSVENKTYCDSLTIQVYNKPKVKFPDYVYSCEPFLSVVCPTTGGSVHTYMWHDGNRDSCRKFEAPGRVWLTVSNPACSATDSTWLVENKKPIYEVVQLDTFCLEGSNYNRVTIKPDTFPSINWNGGDGFQPVYWIYQNQMISVEVMDSNNCTKRSEFLPIDGCNTTFYIPNSFTPNGDGLNDVFSVSGSRIVSVYLRIYNRWGQQVFESKEVDKGWDGSLQGNKCPQDIYYYIVEYSGYLDNELFVKSEKGIIHLLR